MLPVKSAWTWKSEYWRSVLTPVMLSDVIVAVYGPRGSGGLMVKDGRGAVIWCAAGFELPGHSSAAVAADGVKVAVPFTSWKVAPVTLASDARPAYWAA